MKNLKSNLAGQWYSDDAQKLSAELDGYLANVNQEPLENVQAILLPHAGYQYSGQVAAYGINQIKGKSYKRVIVLGPTHRVHMIDTISIPDCDYMETPFGKQSIDTEFIQRLRKYPEVQSIEQVHLKEHSVQIELPMLQYALDDFKFVPIVVGHLDEDTIRKLAKILLNNIDNETLLVVSSDFTHYGKAFGYTPFSSDIESNLEKLDMGAFEYIKRKDTDGFLDYISDAGATICGRYPIAILLEMLTDGSEVHLLEYKKSGHITGDWSHCISYVSAAFTGKWG
jgi:AmmeMemoRadiSam system protein B